MKTLYFSLLLLVMNLSSYAQINLQNTTLTVETTAENLDVPWEILWGPDNHIWFTERSGKIKRLNPETKNIEDLVTISEVADQSESGLLGMALHPNFSDPDSQFVYVVYTYYKGNNLTEKLVRFTYNGTILVSPMTLLDNINANNNHNGSRIISTPDRKLILSTGDAQDVSNAQDKSSLSGKFLRLNLDGTIPTDNPDPSSYIWSIGHRNPQGLVLAPNGKLYSSEHGPNNDDEINIIVKDVNYGWPNVEGYCNFPNEQNFCNANNVTEPIKAWSPTLAVAGIDYYNSDAIPEWKNSILMTSLKESDLRVLALTPNGEAISSEEIFLNNVYGRLRDICISPDGDVYVSTSNKDGRGNAANNDDRIIKIFNADYVTSALDNSILENEEVSFYPNPAKNTLFFNTTTEKEVKILDLLSNEVLSVKAQDQVSISDLKSGVYILEVKTDLGITRNRFVKR